MFQVNPPNLIFFSWLHLRFPFNSAKGRTLKISLSPHALGVGLMHELLEVNMFDIGTNKEETLTYQLNDKALWV